MHGLVIAGLVATAGALGAASRHAVEWTVRSRWPTVTPAGTLVVNVTGSFALGLVIGVATARGLDPDLRTVLGTGFLGAYTTFSTYAVEVVGRAADGHRRLAVAYAAGSVVSATTAAALGLLVTGAW